MSGAGIEAQSCFVCLCDCDSTAGPLSLVRLDRVATLVGKLSPTFQNPAGWGLHTDNILPTGLYREDFIYSCVCYFYMSI